MEPQNPFEHSAKGMGEAEGAQRAAPTYNAIRRAPSLSQQVYEAIGRRIAGGELRPGERVVVEHLAEQLGVSPTPVREALSRLIRDGVIVEPAPNRLQLVSLTAVYVQEVFLVRAALEGLGAELATPRASAAQLAALGATLHATGIALAAGDLGTYAQSDAQLHDFIVETAGNRILAHELQSLRLHINLIRAYSQRHSGEHINHSHQEHLAILRAFEQREPLAARQAVERHIRSASERIIRLIDFVAEEP